MIIVTMIALEKPRFSNDFYPHSNAQAVFSNSCSQKNVFEKLPHPVGFVWTSGITVGKLLRLQISRA